MAHDACAFKDMAYDIARFLTYAIQKTARIKRCHFGGYLGDTGKAALEGFWDVDRTRNFVFYPDEG
jgi:threonine synthase